ncbi:MAG: HEAT repeat domain-containing protein [Planctomycetes bacterium]|nr:HEAT repeat domain-containing protein [Planctomycetota bacterium]MCC7170819.1 HEAT repeat domain-containing protein [Planctomycetota bacterium]
MRPSIVPFAVRATICVAAGVVLARVPLVASSGETAWPYSQNVPATLRFSCAASSDRDEDARFDELTRKDTRPEQRLAAAIALWRGHSRPHASDVLRFIADEPPGGAAYRAFVREVDADLRPERLAQALRDGDYAWAAWLAFLRPDPACVPALQDGLTRYPEHRVATMFALGNSGDERALGPLLEALGDSDAQIAGAAASGLGFLGDSSAELALIDALDRDSSWVQLHAAKALGRVGGAAARAALEEFVKRDLGGGGPSLREVADRALESLHARDR